MTARPTIAFVGVARIDRIFAVKALPDGTTRHLASGYREAVGGVAANAAFAAARLGARARMVGRVGDDDEGRMLRRALERCGVECDGLAAAPGLKTPASAIFVDPAGGRMQVAYRDPALHAGAAPAAGAFRGVDAVMCDLRWPDGAAAALEAASALGAPSLLAFDTAPERGAHRLIDRASHVIFAPDALSDLAGGATPEARLDRVAARSPGRNFAVTAGAEGIVWRDAAGGTGRIEAHEAAAADTLGAADAFHGAAAVALAEGRSFVDALRFANALAALKAARPAGAENLPTLDEAEALMRSAP